MPPSGGFHQTFAPGPFRTPITDDNLPRLTPMRAAKRAPSAAILTGEAGVNLTLSRLQSWGIAAQPAMAGLAYDLVADVPGLDMIRLQVKTKTKPKGQTCSFTLTRGQYYSRAGMFKYAADDYEIAAFVCLSSAQVFFCAAPIHRITVRAIWLRTPGIDRETFQLAVQRLRQRRQAEALSWLASMTSDAQPPMAPSPALHDNFYL